jgi:nicotinate dehydrogenase subunit B
MTGFLNEKEFSRKTFLKGGGALIVGFSALGAIAGKAQAADSPFASNGPTDITQVDSWLTIHADNTLSLRAPNPELGSGVSTGMMMIAAEELDMDVGQLKVVRPDTNYSPVIIANGGVGIKMGGQQIRAAAAAAKQALLGLASTSLGVPATGLTVDKGVVSGGGKTVTYGQLVGDKLFNVTIPVSTIQPGVAPSKPVSQYKLVSVQRVPRWDIPEKVSGAHTYVHNVRLPGMLHGRVVRPRGQAMYGSGAPIVSVDESSIKHIAGAQVIRKGDFLGVVAPNEYDAIQAAAQLKVTWAGSPAMSGSGNLYKQMRADDSAGKSVSAVRVNTGSVDGALASAAHVVSATYKFPFNGHMTIGPSCGVADVTPNGACIFSNTQQVYAALRPMAATLLNLPVNKVRVLWYEGSSTFGYGLPNDPALAAAVMSQIVGKPVRVQLMRWDEHGWDNYGPPVITDIRGGVDASGNIVGYDLSTIVIPLNWTDSAAAPTVELTGTPAPTPLPGSGSVDTTDTGTQYNIPSRRIISKSLTTNYFRTSYVRGPHAPEFTFGSEQLIDELAHAAGIDPYQFRLQNITTAKVNDGFNQWRDALVAVAKLANWQPKVAASKLSDATIVTGRGIALAGFSGSQAAVVADIEVNKKTGKITPKHMYVSAVTGLAVNLEGVESQMSGAANMGLSRVLLEEVRSNNSRVTSLDWVSYPILRFKDHPNTTVIALQRTDLLPTGAGELANVPPGAAIANAFFDATGVRMRHAPLTPAKVRATLKAAGVA